MSDTEEPLFDWPLRKVLDRADELRIENESVRCIRFALDFREQRREDENSLAARGTVGARSGARPEVWWSVNSSVNALLQAMQNEDALSKALLHQATLDLIRFVDTAADDAL